MMWKSWLRRGVLIAWIPAAAVGCHPHRHEPTEEEVRERVHSAAEWALDSVDATDEQQARINGILDRAVGELTPLRAEHRALGRELGEVLEQDAIDRQALESLRERGLALLERASESGTAALADAAEVLTVEQRQKLVARLRRHHGG